MNLIKLTPVSALAGLGALVTGAIVQYYLFQGAKQPSKTSLKTPIRVLITGAAGQIGSALIPVIASGQTFGMDQPLILHLLEIPSGVKPLQGVVMEIEDSAYPLLCGVVQTSDVKEAFTNVDVAIFLGGVPRKAGMERSDLIAKNSPIFIEQGQALNDFANPTCKCLVVANPANTNCAILRENAPKLPAKNFSCLTRLDLNRGIGQLSLKLGVAASDVKDLIVWGNHSNTMVPDVTHARIVDSKSGRATPVIDLVDNAWLESDFVPAVQNRGAAIIKARGQSSGMSVAQAINNHLHDWMQGSSEIVSMGVVSDGSYGIQKGLIFSFPCRAASGEYEIVQGLSLTDGIRKGLLATEVELKSELQAFRDSGLKK